MKSRTLIGIVWLLCYFCGWEFLQRGWRILREKKDETLGYLLIVQRMLVFLAGGYWTYQTVVNS